MATLRPNIEQTRSLGMHASYFNWGTSWLELPAGLSGIATSADLNGRATSMRPPTRTQEKSTINMRGIKVFQHGIMTYNPIQIVFHETVDTKMGTFLERWMDLQWFPNSGLQVPKSLNGTPTASMTNQATLMLTLMDSLDQPRCKYTLIGVWVTGFTHSADYSSNSSDTVKFTVDLSYDYYIYTSLRATDTVSNMLGLNGASSIF